MRPLAVRAALLAGPGEGRTAVELGCGIGIEAAHLVEQGWRVRTVDADPTVSGALEAIGRRGDLQHRTASLEEDLELPPCHLLLACASLPFVRRERFASLWTTIRAALLPGAVLAVDLFGVRDDWSAGEGTFLTRTEVEQLLDGLEVHALEEQERDGRAFSGPKHWHTYGVLAAAPLRTGSSTALRPG